MTVQERLIWVHRLNIAQFVINLILSVLAFMIGLAVFIPGVMVTWPFDNGSVLGVFIFLVVGFVFLMGLLHVILPLLANYTLARREKGWTWVAYGILIYVTITGGGILTVLSLISLILLCDGKTCAYLTGESWTPKAAEEPEESLQIL